MLHTTRAFVLKTIRHGDSTVVLKAYTETLGLRSFLVRVGKKGGVSQAALQPLNRIEIVAQEAPERDLLTVREVRVERPYTLVPFDPVRGTLALFVQEVLYRTVRGEAPDSDLFAFLDEVTTVMDTAPEVRNFPLVFLIRFSEQLGLLPSLPAPGEDHFDPVEGEFVASNERHGRTLGPPLSGIYASLLALPLSELNEVHIPASQRRELLDQQLLYLRLHMEGMGELRSPRVLHQVLG